MRSPLPDSSNLEAGIVEDALPSRLSRVHDNVRDLLRRSVFGSVTSTPISSPTNWPENRVAPSPIPHSAARHSPPYAAPIPSPATSTLCSPDGVPGVLFPPWRPQPVDLPTPNAASPVSAPREHPDVSQNAMSIFLQQKERRRHQHRQHEAWKRPRSRKHKKPVSNIQWVVCSILGFAVFGLLGTCKANYCIQSRHACMLTSKRYRASHYIVERVGLTTRPLRARIAPDKHSLRPHSGQTLLSQRTERKEEENRQDRACAKTQTPPSLRRSSYLDHRNFSSLHSTHAHTRAEPRCRIRIPRCASCPRDVSSERQGIDESASCIRKHD